LVGRSLVDLQVREKYGVNVAVIERGNRTITAPTRNELIFPGDVLYVFGSDEQIEAFRRFVEEECIVPEEESEKENVELQKLLVSGSSVLLGKTIRNSGVRSQTNGLIVGLERNGERIPNPDSELVFEEGDLVWIVGNPDRIRKLEASSVIDAVA